MYIDTLEPKMFRITSYTMTYFKRNILQSEKLNKDGTVINRIYILTVLIVKITMTRECTGKPVI